MIKKRKKSIDSWFAQGSPADTAAAAIRFLPTAWAKLLFLRDFGETEVGGFGISAGDDLLLVEDIQLVQQVCSWSHVALDDESVADFFDQQVDAGRQPEQLARIWLHTHPGDCPQPSMTDEATFGRVFGHSDWAVMLVLACGGQSYARLRFNVGPGADVEIPVDVDFKRPFGSCDPDAWEQEYLASVQPQQSVPITSSISEPVAGSPFDEAPPADWYDGWFDYLEGDDNVEGIAP